MRIIAAISALALALAPSIASATPLCDAIMQIVAASNAGFYPIVTDDGQTGSLVPPGFDSCAKAPERLRRLEYRCRSAAADATTGYAARAQASQELAQRPNSITVDRDGGPLTIFRNGENQVWVWLAGGGADGLRLIVYAGDLPAGE